jgi:ketosteroid isomerase-like protein
VAILSPMRAANLDLVRSIFAAWERGDFRSVKWAHPEIELVAPDGPEPGTWKGLAGMAEGWRDWLHAFKDFHVEVDEYRELDGERVLVLIRRKGYGKASGLELARIGAEGATLFHLRDGKVIRFIGYWDREHALADLGLAKDAEPR